MTRTKRAINSRRRHQKKFQITKGFRGKSSLFKNANQQFLKAFQNAFVSRRLRKRLFRNLWISRINAKVREFGLSYSLFRNLASEKKLNRKALAQIILYD